jgi:hypothetical protein
VKIREVLASGCNTVQHGRLTTSLLSGAMIAAACSAAAASPNASLDDPRYSAVAPADLEAGFRPLSEAELDRLDGVEQATSGWWVTPVRRLELTTRFIHETARAYSTPIRPRDLAGTLATSCEREEGRPCGDGVGGFLELESAGGFGAWATATVRLRTSVGYSEHLELDRAYVHSDLGSVALEAGRDILVFGPSARTQLGWGTNVPPIDQMRVSTARPFKLGSSFQARAAYALGRMRAPQTYPHDLVSIGRLQLDIVGTWHVGVIQLLQLGGDGAPDVGVLDFVFEHFRRRDPTASSTDSSNRRFGGDIALEIPGLWLYYSIVFEDIRRARFIDAFRYDADHLIGMEARCAHLVCVFEWHMTGVRAQEHTPRVTGFSTGGRLPGSPLGPDAQSYYAHATVPMLTGSITPWLELATLSSDTYTFVLDGPISPDVRGPTERRYRAGAHAEQALTKHITVGAQAFIERVTGFAFDPSATTTNAGLSLHLRWTDSPTADVVGIPRS